MRAYLITTSVVFALIVATHIFRIAVEGFRVVAEPIFTIATIVAIALCAWSLYVLKSSSENS